MLLLLPAIISLSYSFVAAGEVAVAANANAFYTFSSPCIQHLHRVRLLSRLVRAPRHEDVSPHGAGGGVAHGLAQARNLLPGVGAAALRVHPALAAQH